jgi:hypothetical protein
MRCIQARAAVVTKRQFEVRYAEGTARDVWMVARETFFECAFASDRKEYVFHLRAWNEQ